MFHGATEITKTDFFSIFNKFSSKTFTSNLCKAAFRKAGLVPFNPSIVLSKIKEYRGIQSKGREESPSIDEDEEPAFTTPPPPPWTEFKTPIINTQRRRGSKYVKGRMLAREITPTTIRVLEKIEKAAD